MCYQWAEDYFRDPDAKDSVFFFSAAFLGVLFAEDFPAYGLGTNFSSSSWSSLASGAKAG